MSVMDVVSSAVFSTLIGRGPWCFALIGWVFIIVLWRQLSYAIKKQRKVRNGALSWLFLAKECWRINSLDRKPRHGVE